MHTPVTSAPTARYTPSQGIKAKRRPQLNTNRRSPLSTQHKENVIRNKNPKMSREYLKQNMISKVQQTRESKPLFTKTVIFTPIHDAYQTDTEIYTLAYKTNYAHTNNRLHHPFHEKPPLSYKPNKHHIPNEGNYKRQEKCPKPNI